MQRYNNKLEYTQENVCLFIATDNFCEIERKLIAVGKICNRDFFNIVHLFNPRMFVEQNTVFANEKSDVIGYKQKNYKGMFCSMPFERLYLYTDTAQLCCPWFIARGRRIKCKKF